MPPVQWFEDHEAYLNDAAGKEQMGGLGADHARYK